MIALIQRVTRASVAVAGETVAAIDAGLLALVAVQPGDGEAQVQRMLERLLGYRVFADDSGRMNRSLNDTAGGLLLRSEEHTSELQSLMRISYAVFCLKKKT